MFGRRRKSEERRDSPSPWESEEPRHLDDWLRAQGLGSDDNPPQTSVPSVSYGDFDPSRIWHLALVQNNINRMSNWSARMKALSPPLVIGVITFLAHSGFPRDQTVHTVVLAILAVAGASLAALVLWCLDAYFLRQERLFRALYDGIRNHHCDIEAFSMDTRPVTPADWTARHFGKLSGLNAFCSKTLRLFHGAIMTFVLGVLVYLIYATDILQRIGWAS